MFLNGTRYHVYHDEKEHRRKRAKLARDNSARISPSCPLLLSFSPCHHLSRWVVIFNACCH
jgi:hypothetical protein